MILNETVKILTLDLLSQYGKTANGTVICLWDIATSLWLSELWVVHLGGIFVYLGKL